MKSGDTFVHAVSWKKRWFVLNEKEQKLSYFTQPNDPQPLGFVDLKTVIQVSFSNEFNGEKEKNGYGFEIHTPSRIYVMIADTQDEMVAWYNALRRLLKLDLEEQSEDWMKDLSLALRGVLIKIRNDSNTKLLRVAFELDGKNQVFRVLPPECIEPHSIGTFGTQSQNGMVGTAGFVEYSFVGSFGLVKFGWQNPLSTLIYKKTAKFECNNPNFSVQSYVRDLNSKRNSLKGKGDLCEVEFILTQNETPNITINTEPPSKEDKRKTTSLRDLLASSASSEPPPVNNNNNSSQPTPQLQNAVPADSPNLFRKSVQVRPPPEPQTVGKVNDRTSEFSEMRKGMKKNIDKECEKIMNRLNMVTFEINNMPPNNSWNFLKAKTVTPSSVVMQDLDDVAVCHVDKYQFKKKTEKFNCGLCGKVICAKCLLPMKIGDQGRYEVNACLTCTNLVNRKRNLTEYKAIVDRARDHPLASLHADVKLLMEEILECVPEYAQSEGKKRQMLEKKIDGLFNDVHASINRLNQMDYPSERDKRIGINLKTAWTQFLQENLIPYKALKK